MIAFSCLFLSVVAAVSQSCYYDCSRGSTPCPFFLYASAKNVDSNRRQRYESIQWWLLCVSDVKKKTTIFTTSSNKTFVSENENALPRLSILDQSRYLRLLSGLFSLIGPWWQLWLWPVQYPSLMTFRHKCFHRSQMSTVPNIIFTRWKQPPPLAGGITARIIIYAFGRRDGPQLCHSRDMLLLFRFALMGEYSSIKGKGSDIIIIHYPMHET